MPGVRRTRDAPRLRPRPHRPRKQLWHIRKGLTAVAGSRPSGTTALLEDIAVPVERLYQTCVEITRVFDLHGYEESVILGHANGNIHFLLNERFDERSCSAGTRRSPRTWWSS